MTRSLTLAPPPGPLHWLFPEVQSFGPRAAVDLDLGMEPLTGVPLQRRVRGLSKLAVAAGPRGMGLLRTLRQALRGTDCTVEVDASIPQFEPWLVAQAHAAPAPDVVLRRCGSWCALDAVPEDECALVPIERERAVETFDALEAAGAQRCIPVFLTTADRPDAATTRLPESWWGLLPGDVYPKPLRERLLAFMQRTWPQRALRFRGLENAALAGFDLYEETLRGRFDAVPRQAPKRRGGPWILGIDGIDGAGKSTQIQALRRHLEGQGLRVAVHKMYRHGVFHDTVTDLTRQCAGEKNLHLWPLQRHIKLFDSVKYYFAVVEPSLAQHDVLIFDRYVQTHLAAGLGRFGHDPYARELTAVYPRADRVFVLDLPVEVAMERIGRRDERTVDENPYMLSRYRALLRSFAAPPQLTILDAQRPAAEVTDAIRGSVDRLFEAEESR